ncbi:MAG: IgGFc-binding protein, partial [Chitinophagaceae bacterium]
MKGRNALGNSFFIPAQNVMGNSGSPNPKPYNSFDIVATEDATIVTITPSADIDGHSAGIPFNITLNRGETYSATATSNLASNHLMGSVVISTKPIAITIKDDTITGGGYATCSDLAGDQLVPLSLVGTKYISLPGDLSNPSTQPSDIVFVLATQNNTTVTINGTMVATLNIGETHKQNSFNNVYYIETSKPVYVLHLSGFGCEVGQALLPQLECSGSRTVGFTRSVNSPLFANILVPTGGEGNFTFNGNTSTINAAQFNDVPNTNGAWKYARISIGTNEM